MNGINDNRNEPCDLVGVLTGRYGRLALTRAAGEAAAAERTGDKARSALWYGVITQLRQSIITAQPTEAV